jgi:predicted ATP-dependent serine protease
MEQNQNELLAEAMMRRLGLSDREPSEEDKQYDEAVRKAIEEYEKGKKSIFTNVMDIPEADWIVEGFVVEEGLTLLFGDSRVGKTSLMLQLITCLAEGKEFLGLDTRKAEMLLIEQDEGKRLLRNHIQRMLPVYPSLKWTDVPNSQISWNSAKKEFQYSEHSLEKLISYFWHPIVIIDSLSSLGIEDINHPSCSLIFDRLRDITGKCRCSFIVLHHPNKSGDVMGSNLIKAKVDCMLHLQKDKLIFEKVRGELPKAVTEKPGEAPSLNIKQDPNFLVFRMGMAERARMLVSQGIERDAAIVTLESEYGASRANARTTYNRAKQE